MDREFPSHPPHQFLLHPLTPSPQMTTVNELQLFSDNCIWIHRHGTGDPTIPNSNIKEAASRESWELREWFLRQGFKLANWLLDDLKASLSQCEFNPSSKNKGQRGRKGRRKRGKKGGRERGGRKERKRKEGRSKERKKEGKKKGKKRQLTNVFALMKLKKSFYIAFLGD